MTEQQRKRPAKRGKYQDAGPVYVDSGLVWIGDPGYLIDPSGTEQVGWDELVQKIHGDEGAATGVVEPFDPGKGMAVMCHDGVYGVTVHRNGDGDIDGVYIDLNPFSD